MGKGLVVGTELVMGTEVAMGNGLVFEGGPLAPLYLITKFGYWTFNG